MKKMLMFLLVLTLGITHAQKKADALFEKYLKATGIQEKGKNVKAILQKGTIKQGGQEISYERYQSKDGAGYMKMNMMGMELIVYALKDGKGYKMNQSMGYDDLTEDQAKEIAKQNKNLFGDESNYKELERKYLGKEEKNGIKYDVVEVKQEDQTMKFYFNPKTHLLDYITGSTQQGEMVTEFKDYKDFNGIKRPTKIISKMGDTVVSEMTVEDFILDPAEVKEEIFEKPEY